MPDKRNAGSSRPTAAASLGDQLKGRFRESSEAGPNAQEQDINQALAKDFEQWLSQDEKDASKDGHIGSALRRNKARYDSPEPVAPGPKVPARGPLSGMESRHIYEQLTLKQKKEIAWLLREDDLV